MNLQLKYHFLLTLLLTGLIMIAMHAFRVKGYTGIIDSPQFEYIAHIERIGDIIQNGAAPVSGWRPVFWYRSYFVIDFLWAFALLSLVYRYIRREIRGENWKDFTWLPGALVVASVAAYGCDMLENIAYLCFSPKVFGSITLSSLISVKTICYRLVIALIAVYLYKKYISDHLARIQAAVRASFISILAIVALMVLAAFVDQGSTVILHLFQEPVSMFLAVFFINILALASAHYPDYLDKYIRNTGDITWQLRRFWGMTFLGLGLVNYKFYTKPDVKPDSKEPDLRHAGEDRSEFFNHFRKITGLLVHLTWIYALLFMMDKYELFPISSAPVTGILVFLFLFLYVQGYTVKTEWQKFYAENEGKALGILTGEIKNQNAHTAGEPGPPDVRLYLAVTLLSFLLSVIFTLLGVMSVWKGDWVLTWKAMLVTAFFSTFFFIFFQHFRVFFDAYRPPVLLRLALVSWLGHDLSYVRMFATAGTATLLFFVLTTPEPGRINALVLILAWLYLVYGVIIIFLKHMMFYRSPDSENLTGKESAFGKVFFKEFAPVFGLLLAGCYFFAEKAGNDLHRLPEVAETAEHVVSLDSCLTRLASRQPDTTYFIASYGGGLRATAWTMLLLDTLQKTQPGVWASTVAMSGVSGGFLGLSMHTANMAEHRDAAPRSTSIEAIGRHNLLSIDVSYLLGFDLIREMIPRKEKFRYRDRAGRSMQEYAALLQADSVARNRLLRSSYRNYWGQAWQQDTGRAFPVLIGNTTGTHSRYGVAFSVASDKTEAIFPGAVDILSLNNSTSISYLDATSTTERFPILSPAAQIKGKGYFLDGGYFENSGLLSLMNFYDHIKSRKDTLLAVSDSTSRIILIINSKDAYIRKIISDSAIDKKERPTDELGAILATVADIDILPLALERRYRTQFGPSGFVAIYLPYPVTLAEVEDQIRGKPIDPFELQERINASNQKIDDALKAYISGHRPEWLPGIKHKEKRLVPPALARVLSDPAFYYLKAMLGHEEVVQALRGI